MPQDAASDIVADSHRRVALAKTRLLYRHGYSVLAGVFGVAVLMVVALWPMVDHRALLTWMGAFTALLGARFLLIRRFPPDLDDLGRARRWCRYYAIGTGLSGVLWGSANWVFFLPDEPMVVAVLVTFTLGVSAAAATSTALYYPAFFAFVLPALVPAAAMLVLAGGILKPLGIAVVLYIAGSALFARQYHTAVHRALQLRFENLDLLNRVTEEKDRAEREKLAAENANRDKSRFLAATSHDLRQPMHALGLFIDTLESTEDAHTRKLLVGRIRNSVDALESLFNALLDVSKLDAGVVTPQIEDFRIQDLLKRLEHEFAALALHYGNSLQFVDSSLVVRSDPVLLERILRNVLSNSIHYTKRGGVLVGARRHGGRVRLEIWDQGVGIPRDQLDNVFSEFLQLGNPERDRNKGLGLGLAIVQRLCNLLNHDCQLQSTKGKGTVFRVTLARGETERVVDKSAVLDLNLQSHEGKHALVIDDEAEIRESMLLILSKWGYQVSQADGVSQAVSIAEMTPTPIDVVISDYRLRENTTGVDAIRAVQGVAGRTVPAILITGDTSPDILRLAGRSGFPVLHKPVKPARLRIMLAQILSSSSGPARATSA